MKNTTYMPQTKVGHPRTTAFKAAQIASRKYYIDPKVGRVYNKFGEEVGGNTYEPRVTVHLEDRKYGIRVNKLVAFVTNGPEALRRGVSVRHKNGNIEDNRGSNLKLVYNRQAMRNYRRLMAS
jgi:hypothetical protein